MSLGRGWLMWILAGAVTVPALFFAPRLWRVRPDHSQSVTVGSGSAGSGEKGKFKLALPPTEVARLLPELPEAKDGPSPRFVDWSSAAGIQFRYFPDVRTDRFFLPEDMGGGAGWLDFDGDGRLDLFFTNGCQLPHDPESRRHVQQLYRQTESGQFVEIGNSAGAALSLYGQGCSAADCDNDGFPDLVLTSYGGVTLLSNHGDGTFGFASHDIGLDDPGWSTSPAWGDLDRDGDLDLYVAHYAITTIESTPVCMYENGKVRGYCGPASYVCERDGLFLNQGNGIFQRAPAESGCDVEPSKPGKGLGVVIADLDDDAWPEIYVANDMDPNFLFRNQGRRDGETPRFDEVGLSAGAAVSVEGVPEASMGVACADFTGAHHLDIFLTHYYLQKNTFYQNNGNLFFSDRSTATGLAAPSLPFLGFGTVPIDYDLDGWQDLFISNGHVLGKNIQPYAMRPQMFRNLGKARFVEVTKRAGPYFFDLWVGRGAALADFDNDGDEDISVVHHDDRPVALLRNETERIGRPLGLELVGSRGPRSAIGARVTVRSGDWSAMREIIGGGSYLSSSELRIRVGLDVKLHEATVEVRWPSGHLETWTGLQPGRYWQLVERCSSRPAREQTMATAP